MRTGRSEIGNPVKAPQQRFEPFAKIGGDPFEQKIGRSSFECAAQALAQKDLVKKTGC